MTVEKYISDVQIVNKHQKKDKAEFNWRIDNTTICRKK